MLLPNMSTVTCDFNVLKELSDKTIGAKSLLCSSDVLSRNSDRETPKVEAINKNDKNNIIAFAQENLLFTLPILLSNLQTPVSNLYHNFMSGKTHCQSYFDFFSTILLYLYNISH